MTASNGKNDDSAGRKEVNETEKHSNIQLEVSGAVATSVQLTSKNKEHEDIDGRASGREKDDSTVQKEANETERHTGIQPETLETGATNVQDIYHTPEETKVDQEASRDGKYNSEEKDEVGHSSTNKLTLWENTNKHG